MAGGVINTGSAPKLLWPGLHTIWGQIYNQYSEQYIHLVDIFDSNQAYEQDYQVIGFGLAQQTPQGSPGYFDSSVAGTVTTYQHIDYTLGYIVTDNQVQDNLYKKVSENYIQSNAIGMKQTVENIAAGLYNNGFNTDPAYAIGDGQPFFSASHPFATGGTGSNILAPSADLSEASIEDLTIQIMQTTDDRGLRMNLMPMSLHIAPQQYYNANRILNSVLQSDTANNNINVLKAEGVFPKGIKLNNYFTSPNAWFIRTNIPNGPKMYWRKKPDLREDNDFDTRNHKYLAAMRLSVGVTDWRGAFGSNGP